MTVIAQPKADLNPIGLTPGSVVPPVLNSLGDTPSPWLRFQMPKWRLREGRRPAQEHTASCSADPPPPVSFSLPGESLRWPSGPLQPAQVVVSGSLPCPPLPHPGARAQRGESGWLCDVDQPPSGSGSLGLRLLTGLSQACLRPQHPPLNILVSCSPGLWVLQFLPPEINELSSGLPPLGGPTSHPGTWEPPSPLLPHIQGASTSPAIAQWVTSIQSGALLSLSFSI